MSSILRVKSERLKKFMSEAIYPNLNPDELEKVHAYHHTGNLETFTKARIAAFSMLCPSRVRTADWDWMLWTLAGCYDDIGISAATAAAIAVAQGENYKSSLGIEVIGGKVRIKKWASIYSTMALSMAKVYCDEDYAKWLSIARPGHFDFNPRTQELTLVA